jgi:hypothetical protein
MGTYSTERFLQIYFNALRSNKSLQGDYWQRIIDSIIANDSIKQSAYETLELVLNRELNKCSKNQLLAIYKETENWLSMDDASDEYLSEELLKIELIEELMDEITNIAWEQAKNE